MPNQTTTTAVRENSEHRLAMSNADGAQSAQPAQAAPHLEALVQEHYAYIQRLALSILNDPHDAEDAAQETFIAAHRAWASFRGDAAARTWLTSIAVNACRGRLRKRKVRQGLQNTLIALHLLRSRPPSPEQSAIQNEASRLLWQAVDTLDEKHRLPLILRYVHELSVAQIAAALRISPGTVHSRLHYARLKLQQSPGRDSWAPGEEPPQQTLREEETHAKSG